MDEAGPMRSMDEDLEVLRGRVDRTLRSVRHVDTLPAIAVEAVEDLEASMRNFALRWLDDLTPEARKDMGAAFVAYDQLRAQVDRAAAEVLHRRLDSA